jgi:hypothetical protein
VGKWVALNLNYERAWKIARDQLLFFGGLSGIAFQQLTGDVNLALLGLYGGMIGLAGLFNIKPLVQLISTQSTPSEQASSESDTPSQSSSSK